MTKTIFCDLDGVCWHGDTIAPTAESAIKLLRASQYTIVYLTNNANRSRQSTIEMIQSFDPNEAALITSADVACRHIVEKHGQDVAVFLCVGLGGQESAKLARLNVVESGSAAVLVGGKLGFNFDDIAGATREILNGAEFVATNDDPTFPTEHGLLPGAGALVAAIATVTDVRPLVIGKPNDPMIDYVQDYIGEETIMIGDAPHTDGEFARKLGIHFALVESDSTRNSLNEATWRGGDLIGVAEQIVAAQTS